MATRLLILDHAGVPLMGCDAHHGDDHAAAWVEDALALAAANGHPDAIALEFDAEAGGDDARDHIRNLHELRVELRARPDGLRELVALHRGRVRRIARALRVLHAPEGALAHPIGTVRGKPGSVAERAARWRQHTHPATARLTRRRTHPE